MSYAKAAELLDLALEVAAQRHGMSYSSIDARSSAPSPAGRRRNTQRLVRALEQVFGDRVTTGTSEIGEKTVHLRGDPLKRLVELTAAEMAALDHAITVLDAANAGTEIEALKALRTKMRLLAPKKRMASVEVDYEALLSASHMAVRPGPRPRIDSAVMRPLTEAILALRLVAFDYVGPDGMSRRVVNPYGVIFGHRAYLIAQVEDASASNPSRWRIDRITNVEVLEAPLELPEAFDLRAYALRSFGAFHSEDEYGEVEWRFSAKVAENVRGYRFHPDQEIVEEKDGSVTVRFRASGHLEMVWALYPWGDNIEVIKPEAVRRMVRGYRRNDFPGIP